MKEVSRDPRGAWGLERDYGRSFLKQICSHLLAKQSEPPPRCLRNISTSARCWGCLILGDGGFEP